MFGMFEDCSSLDSLDLSSFDTNKVIDYQGMFYCTKLNSNNIKLKKGETKILQNDSFSEPSF